MDIQRNRSRRTSRICSIIICRAGWARYGEIGFTEFRGEVLPEAVTAEAMAASINNGNVIHWVRFHAHNTFEYFLLSERFDKKSICCFELCLFFHQSQSEISISV